ncbi:hypothetical protein B5P44_15475 [Mycobacterium sp. CBMA 213]|nr:hypothetical protein [Mycolicibacterium sp. CBMA 213]
MPPQFPPQGPPPGPPPGWVGAPGGYGAQPNPYGVPPKKRKRWPLAIGAIVVVLVVVGAGLYFFTPLGSNGSNGSGGPSNPFASGQDDGKTPGDVVKGYLEALSRGDADAALSYSSEEPANKDLLTNDILKQQIAKMPISNIRILNVDTRPMGTSSTVHVAMDFGGQPQDFTVFMPRTSAGPWRLKHAALKVDFSSQKSNDPAAFKGMTVFGKEIGDDPIFLFPGFIDVGTSNPNITVTAKPLRFAMVGSPMSSGVDLTFAVSDAGKKAATDALVSAFASCAQSHAVKPPPPCLAEAYSDYQDGSVSWGAPDLSGLGQPSLGAKGLTVLFDGIVDVPISGMGTDGKPLQGPSKTGSNYIVDLGQAPPVVTRQY